MHEIVRCGVAQPWLERQAGVHVEVVLRCAQRGDSTQLCGDLVQGICVDLAAVSEREAAAVVVASSKVDPYELHRRVAW